MARRRATGEEIADHFYSLPRGAGTTEERLKATAKYFGVTPATVQKHLKFWWPGKKYVKEFEAEASTRLKWDRPTEVLLEAMQKYKSVAQASKALKTTAITLNKALERHGIVQVWVVQKKG